MGAEETKEVYDEWNGKIHPYLLPMHLMTTLGDVNDDLKDMEETVTEAGMESILYTDRTSAISDVAEGTGILNGYIMSLIPTAKSRLDDPLYKGFDQGATEMLSRIRMEDYATDNTLSIKDHSVMHGGYGEVYEYDIKKDKLTIDDFLGLNSLKGTGEPGSLTNVPKEFQSFTDMFTLDYNEIKEQLKDGDGRQIDLETYLKYISTLGEYDHKMDKPFENFISGILDVTIVKPVIEACTGYDLITGEDLSDLERGLKAVFAVVDVVTLCVGIKGSDLAKLGVKGALKFTGKTMLVDMAAFTASYGVGKLGEELGLPLPLTLILSGAAGITVSIKLGKYVFKDSTGKVILESNVDEVLDTIEGVGGAKGLTDGKLDVTNTEALKKNFSGKSVDEIADILRDSGYDVTIKNSTRSSSGAQIIKVNNPGGGKNITQVQVSPGGGRHGELPYVKISTDIGKIKIIDGPSSSYKTDGLEKSVNIFTEGGK